MSLPGIATTTELDSLKFDFIVSVSVLGGVCIFLLVAVVGLFIWNTILARKIRKLDPFVNFKLQRPKLITEDPFEEPQRNFFENPGYTQSLPSQPVKRDLNPIALRSKASFDNGNFMFGSPANKMSSNSFKSPDYLDQDSRFY